MLTIADTEILAFEEKNASGDVGEPYCRDCGAKKWSTVLMEKCEAGLDDRLHPVPRWMLEDMADDRLEEEREEGYGSSTICCEGCGEVLAKAVASS